MNLKPLILIIPLIGLAAMKNKIVAPSLSRGYRNNNPLNIRISGAKWKGEVPHSKNTDGTFEQFTDKKFGYRAAAKLVLNYNKLYNIFTVEGIINRWAPEIGHAPSGQYYTNHTQAYIDFVCKLTGFDPNTLINGSNVGELVWTMAQFENAPPHPDTLAFVNSAVSEFSHINY